MTIEELVAESNRIEGITRKPTLEEIDAFNAFLKLRAVSVSDLESFVEVYQPGAKLRDKPGMDVQIGNHGTPPGGEETRYALVTLLYNCNRSNAFMAYYYHKEYESLQPFTIGNGRSGRMLWYWMMRETPKYSRGLGFLHCWYYQSLEHS